MDRQVFSHVPACPILDTRHYPHAPYSTQDMWVNGFTHMSCVCVCVCACVGMYSVGITRLSWSLFVKP
jgi:hypothetical protein